MKFTNTLLIAAFAILMSPMPAMADFDDEDLCKDYNMSRKECHDINEYTTLVHSRRHMIKNRDYRYENYNDDYDDGEEIEERSVKIGDIYYHSDGTTTMILGDTAIDSDGTVRQTLGDTVYSTDGRFIQRKGNTVYHQDGTKSTITNNGIYDSNGATLKKEGNIWYYKESAHHNMELPYPNVESPYPNVESPYPNTNSTYFYMESLYPNMESPYPNTNSR